MKILGILIIVTMILLGVQQVYAYTIFEFDIANSPTTYQNITYTAYDHSTGLEYKWLDLINEEYIYYQLHGARDASNDPQVIHDRLEPNSFSPITGVAGPDIIERRLTVSESIVVGLELIELALVL